MHTQFYPAGERGTKDLGWLLSQFSFSFSSFMQPNRMGFGLLQTFNDDLVKPGGGFGLHPHKNMEIISIMLAGKMNHKDSMGYSEVVERGWVQLMSAGSGLRHEEYNVGDDDVRFLQIWISPKQQNIDPRYQRRFFSEESRTNGLATVVSSEEGQGHCWINQNARILWGGWSGAGSLEHHFSPVNKAVFLFVLEGTVQVNGQTVGRRDALGIWGTDRFSVDYSAGTELVLVEVPVN
jgi:redox-sensitive bicupin YhaK (pirin superfamily)